MCCLLRRETTERVVSSKIGPQDGFTLVQTFGVLLVFLMVAAAACDGEPQLAATPEPTNTLTPTSTPKPTPTETSTLTPTVTPTQEPSPTPASTPTATATPPVTTPALPTALIIDESTIGRDVFSFLAEDEASCIREELGEGTFEETQGQAVMNGHDWFDSMPIGCLAEETAIELSIALVDAAAGGLSADSRECLAEVYAETDAIALGYGLSSITPDSNEPEAIRFSLRFVVCLTDEESHALAAQPGGSEVFTPSELRCLLDRLDLEKFVSFLHNLTEVTGQPSPEFQQTFEEVTSAIDGCGIALSGDPPGETLTLDALRTMAEDDPALQPLVECLEQRSTPEEIAAYFAGLAPTPQPDLLECLEEYGHQLFGSPPPDG